LNANPDQKDTDRDGTGDVCDATFNSTPCKTSGIGGISSMQSFSLGVESFANSTTISGSVSYTDRAGKSFKSTKITGIVCWAGKQATIVGNGTVNTKPVTFQVDLGDYGTGTTDTFGISWSSATESYTQAPKKLTSGDIVITLK
jgi:hypothetical protein